MPWTVLDNSESAMAFADRSPARPRLRRAQRTSISGSDRFRREASDESGLRPCGGSSTCRGTVRTIRAARSTEARDEAVAKGITINGLPIMLSEPGYLDIPELDNYYSDCVIGGQGAFMVPVREREQFREAIRTKILLEIAELAPAGAADSAGQASPGAPTASSARCSGATGWGIDLGDRASPGARARTMPKKAEMADFVAAHGAVLAPLRVVRHRHDRRDAFGTLPGPLRDASEKRPARRRPADRRDDRRRADRRARLLRRSALAASARRRRQGADPRRARLRHPAGAQPRHGGAAVS